MLTLVWLFLVRECELSLQERSSCSVGWSFFKSSVQALSDPTIISHSEQPRPSAPSAPSQAPEPALPTDSRTRSAFLIHPPQNDAFTLPQSNRASSSGLKARPTAATSAYPPRRSLSTVPPAGTFEDFQSQADEAVLNFDEGKECFKLFDRQKDKETLLIEYG